METICLLLAYKVECLRVRVRLRLRVRVRRVRVRSFRARRVR